LILAVIIASGLGAPALFEVPWRLFGPIVFAINVPGIFLAVPHVPPEGYPGQSVVHAATMLVTQAVIWFTLLSVCTLMKAWATRRDA
jgi:hypothetical protein